MKMNYEKKYKDVQKWIASIYTKLNYIHQMEAEALFPALRERKDERIRETLIKYIKNWQEGHSKWNSDKDFCNDAIAWLEKQGKQKPTWSEYDDKMMYYTNEFLKYHENSDPTATSCIKWLESLKPHNNIEPKFKVGDWVVNSQGKVNQISSVADNGYGFCLYDGTYIGGCWKDDYHHWTIQDAKDGDVLVVNNEVFIYAHRKQMYCIAVAHCFVDIAGDFYIDGEFGYVEYGKTTISPATKEMCDLLFQKMKEEGYEWDDDKKELKNTEHSNEESNKIQKTIRYDDTV